MVVPLKSYSATVRQLLWETVLPRIIPALPDSDQGFELKSATSVSLADSEKVLNHLAECPVQQFIVFSREITLSHSTLHKH